MDGCVKKRRATGKSRIPCGHAVWKISRNEIRVVRGG